MTGLQLRITRQIRRYIITSKNQHKNIHLDTGGTDT